MQFRGDFLRPTVNREEEWARRSYIQLNAIREVHKLVQELQKRLVKVKIHVYTGLNYPRSDQSIILKVTCFLFSRNGCSIILR